MELTGYKKELDRKETEVMNRFKGEYSPYEFLIKSENGKDMAIRLFSKNFNYISKEMDRIFLLLDLDDKDVDTLLKKIETCLNSKCAGEKFYIKNKKIKENTKFYLFENEVENLKFYTIFFKKSLEKQAEIKDKESKESKEKKIKELAKQKEFLDILDLFNKQ